MDDPAAIAARLAELRELDPKRMIFGASTHDHALRAPVDPALLARVEDTVGMPLPEDHRAFLTAVGDGGPGPYYGLIPLTEAVERVSDAWGASVLGADNPLTGDVDFGEVLGRPADWDEHVALLEADPAYAAGYDRLEAEYLDEPWCNGRLPLADHGCGDWYFLMLRGPRRGTVWVDSVVGATGLYCLEVGFLTWYGRWLDDALHRVAAGEFAPVDAEYSFLRHGDNPRYRVVPPAGS